MGSNDFWKWRGNRKFKWGCGESESRSNSKYLWLCNTSYHFIKIYFIKYCQKIRTIYHFIYCKNIAFGAWAWFYQRITNWARRCIKTTWSISCSFQFYCYSKVSLANIKNDWIMYNCIIWSIITTPLTQILCIISF